MPPIAAAPVVRPATEGDAAALAALAEATFRDAFAGDNTAGDVDAHCARHYGQRRQLEEIRDPAMATFVAESAGRLVGFGQLRAGHAPACVRVAPAREVQRLYVDRDWHGKGVAQALMAAMLALARGQGAGAAWLGVWERNPRAIAFYRKMGFEPVGEHVFTVGSDPQRDLVLLKALAGSAPRPAG